MENPLPMPSAHSGDWRGGGSAVASRRPRGTALPFGSTTRTDVPPTSAPTPSPRSLVPGSQGSPPQSLHPGQRSRVRRARQAICAKGSPHQEGGRAPRPGAQGSVCGSGAARTSAGGGRGRPERDRLWSARPARLDTGGAPRGWRPQDQKSDSGSGQMSCYLSTARAAAQHSPL